MIRKYPTLILFTIIFNLHQILITAHQHRKCNPTCGKYHLQYPFGFSDGCQIKLNYSAATGEANIGNFPIQSVNSESIIINIQRNCNRSLETLSPLFNKQYAPTFRNAILLHNCSSQISSCEIPSILVKTSFESLSCNNNSVSCYSENGTEFIDFDRIKRTQCRYVLSNILAEGLNKSKNPLSLGIEVVELGWWLDGECQCDNNANCTPVVLNNGNSGYRCRCNEGFDGDGFRTGLGCRKG